jgi:hypothetical protein
LIRIENLATKWLSIDIRNMCQESEIPKKDIRFSLLSEKEIILNNSTENEINNILAEKIKQGIIKIKPDESIVVTDDFKQCDIFVRHSKSIKFNGNFENWKPIFDMAKISFSQKQSEWLEHIIVSISDGDEFSENDENGMFKIKTNRKEVVITYKKDLLNLSLLEFKKLSFVMWQMSQMFSKILN